MKRKQKNRRDMMFFQLVVGGPAQKVPNFQMDCMGKKVTRIVAITHLMVMLKFGLKKSTPSCLTSSTKM
jgi:hypothetical protein